MKITEPIIDPATIIAESNRDRTRLSSSTGASMTGILESLAIVKAAAACPQSPTFLSNAPVDLGAKEIYLSVCVRPYH